MRMPGLSGLDVLRSFANSASIRSSSIMTGFGTMDTAVEAMQLGAVDFVQKPFFRDELLMRVRAAADRRQLARQVDLLQRHIRAGGPLDDLDRRERADAAGQGADSPCGARSRNRAHYRRDRNREGARGARDSRGQPAGRWTIRGVQLCGVDRVVCWKMSSSATAKARLPVLKGREPD